MSSRVCACALALTASVVGCSNNTTIQNIYYVVDAGPQGGGSSGGTIGTSGSQGVTQGLGGTAIGGSVATGGLSGKLSTGGSAGSGGAAETSAVSSVGGALAIGGAWSIGGVSAAGGAWSIGGVSATGGSWGLGGTPAAAGAPSGGRAGTGGAPITGGAPATGGASWTTCSQAVIPTTPGNLSITSSYLTKGSLHGYAFTWSGARNNTSTCITPTCDASGCSPAFGSTSICAAGIVAPDTSYNSIVGLGFNLNQDVDAGAIGDIPIASSITVTTYVGRQIGDASLRVQLTTKDGTSYCAEAGRWTSGTPIPIGTFNTACWDNTGTAATASIQVTALNLLIPSDATATRPFDVCLLDVAIQ